MPILAESNDSRNLPIFIGEGLPFQFPLGDRQFLYRSLKDFLAFGQQLCDLEQEGLNNEWREFPDQSFFKTASTLTQSFFLLPDEAREKLINVQCPYWTISCLKKILKIPQTQFSNFLDQIEKQAQETGRILAKQIEKLAQTFLVRRRHYLALAQVVSKEDWEFVALKLNLEAEQLEQVKLEASQFAQPHPKTGEEELTTDAIIFALEICGIAPDSLLSPAVRFKRQTAITQATQALLEASESEKWQLQQEISQLQQKIASFEQLKFSNSEPETIEGSRTFGERSVESEETEGSSPSAFPANNLLVKPQTQPQLEPQTNLSQPLFLFNEEPLNNLSVRVVRDGYPAETGRLLASMAQGVDWQVLLDNQNESAHQTIGIYKMEELEIKYPPEEEFKPLSSVSLEVGIAPEIVRPEQEFKEQSWWENFPEFLSLSSHRRKRQKARGFA